LKTNDRKKKNKLKLDIKIMTRT